MVEVTEGTVAVDAVNVEGEVVSETVETTVGKDGSVIEETTTTVVEVTVENGDEKPDSLKVDSTVEDNSAVTVAKSEVIVNGDASDVEVDVDAKQEVPEIKVEDAEDVTGTGTTTEVTATEEVVTEGTIEVTEETEEEPPKVMLYQFPPGEHIPNLSPFCLKLETFLRINEIPYENQYGYKVGKKGKLPWIEYKGERIPDSNMIITFLNDAFKVDMDKNFSAEKIALGTSVQRMLEENTYWALIYNRYVDNFHEYKKFTAPPTGTGIGFNITQKMFQRKMKSNLEAHGLGLHSKETVYAIALEDLQALSDILGGNAFLLGDSPSTFDCSVFGLCANILYSGMVSPLSTFVKENANLSSFCERMKDIYWSNWSDAVRKPESAPLKRGFSFKKKSAKAGKGKPEDTDSEVSDSPVDGDVAIVVGDVATVVTVDTADTVVPVEGDTADIPDKAASVTAGEVTTDIPAEVPASDNPLVVTTAEVTTDVPNCAADEPKDAEATTVTNETAEQSSRENSEENNVTEVEQVPVKNAEETTEKTESEDTKAQEA